MLFEALWLLLIWVISPFVSDGFALIISPITAIAVSLAMLPGISYIYSILKKKDLFDPKMASFVLYGISYLLTLYLTVVLLEKFVWTFHIDEIKNVEFALQAIPFIFYIVVFSVFRDPKQLQYGAYALAYGLFVVWEWAENWGIASSLLTKIDTEFTLRFYIIPFKEAMLLFIILDTFFKARHESKAGKGAV